MRVEPGDLILVRSRGWVTGLGRRLTGNPYDHVAVVAGQGRTLNIDKPGARWLPAERLLRPSLHPLVLRPRFGSDDERARFVAEIERLADAPYDVARTLGLIARLLSRRVVGRARPLPRLEWARDRWICTDAVLLGLEKHVSGFGALRTMALDWVTLASATTNDLLEVSRRRPDLLARVSPSPDGLAGAAQ